MKRPRNACRSVETTSSPQNRAVDGAFLDRTAQLFDQRTGRKLNREDARQIVENVTGFFRLLAEWQNME